MQERHIVTAISRGIDPHAGFRRISETCAHNPDLRFIVSNTTEAGIVYRAEDRQSDRPPVSFPAKLTQLLIERYKAFDGDSDEGICAFTVRADRAQWRQAERSSAANGGELEARTQALWNGLRRPMFLQIRWWIALLPAFRGMKFRALWQRVRLHRRAVQYLGSISSVGDRGSAGFGRRNFLCGKQDST